jgi:prepilin-type N-terminal cleavage/methylation domain-containing protein
MPVSDSSKRTIQKEQVRKASQSNFSVSLSNTDTSNNRRVHWSMQQEFHKAFTLAELLIALAILGVIATFTIPKVLVSQQDARYSAAAKEAASAVSAAYNAAVLNGSITTTSGMKDLTPYLNYVQVDTASSIDNIHSYGSFTTTCGGSGARCVRLHNGALLKYYPQDTFGGTASTNGVVFLLDPDGQVTSAGSATGPGKSIGIFLFYNGRITDVSKGPSLSYDNGAPQTWAVCPACTPSWFSW